MRLVVRVTVDPEAWAEEYSLSPEGVRADVRSYLANQIWTGNEGTFLEVEVSP